MPKGCCKFKPEWKKIYPWLHDVPDDLNKAKCKTCNKVCSISNGGISDVTKHQGSYKHKTTEEAASTSVTLPMFLQCIGF